LVDLSIEISRKAKKELEKFEKIRTDQIPAALSQALRETVSCAASEAAKSAEKSFDRPTDFVKQDPTSPGPKGMIRFKFDSKKEIQRKGIDKASASVFIVDGLVDIMERRIKEK